MELARDREAELDQLAARVNPSSYDADRIYRWAAVAKQQREQIEREVQRQSYRLNPTTTNSAKTDTVNRTNKTDRWNSNNPREEKNIKRDLVAPTESKKEKSEVKGTVMKDGIKVPGGKLMF